MGSHSFCQEDDIMRFYRVPSYQRVMVKRASRMFYRDYKVRQFCRCELCLLKYGRLLYPKRGGQPLQAIARPGRFKPKTPDV